MEHNFDMPPRGDKFTRRYIGWLYKRYGREMADLQAVYPDIAEFFHNPTREEANKMRLADAKAYIEATGDCPIETDNASQK